MVIITYGKSIARGVRKDVLSASRDWALGKLKLSSPALGFCNLLRFGQNLRPIGVRDPHQNLVHSFLDAGIGPVEPAGSLGGKLAKHIPVTECM